MKGLWRSVATIVALGICGSAVAADPHLFSDESAVLHTGSVTVLFMDPAMELDVYLKMNSRVDMPPGGGAIGGGGRWSRSGSRGLRIGPRSSWRPCSPMPTASPSSTLPTRNMGCCKVCWEASPGCRRRFGGASRRGLIAAS